VEAAAKCGMLSLPSRSLASYGYRLASDIERVGLFSAPTWLNKHGLLSYISTQYICCSRLRGIWA